MFLLRAYAGRLFFTGLNLSVFQYWLDSVSHKGNHIIPSFLKKAWTPDKRLLKLKLSCFLVTQATSSERKTLSMQLKSKNVYITGMSLGK